LSISISFCISPETLGLASDLITVRIAHVGKEHAMARGLVIAKQTNLLVEYNPRCMLDCLDNKPDDKILRNSNEHAYNDIHELYQETATEPRGSVKLSIRNCGRWPAGVNVDSSLTGRYAVVVSRGALAIAWTAAACWSASAAQLTTLSKDNGTIVVLNGELAPGDTSRFKDILKASSAAGKPVSAVRLNSPGGSLREGVRLAGVIQDAVNQGAKIATVITAGAKCVGACFLPFIAGRQKYVSATATVSVPGAAEKPEHEPKGNTPAIVRSETPAIVLEVQKLGLLDAIVTKMLTTPEDATVTLTLDDLRAMGATMTGKPAKPR
jgi:hypothetical protein